MGKRLSFFLIIFVLSQLFLLNTWAVENIVVLDFTLNSGSTQNQWMIKALSLDIADNLALLNNFQTVSYQERELLLLTLPLNERQDPYIVGKLCRATLVVTGELIEEKNSIILEGKIYRINTTNKSAAFSISGHTNWLLDFSDNVVFRVLDLANLRKFTPQDEDRLRFKMKNNERLKEFLNAETSFINEDYPKSLQLYEDLLGKEPNFVTPYVKIATICFKMLESEKNTQKQNAYLDKINENLKKALALDPLFSQVYYYLGKLYSEKTWVSRNYQTAITLLQKTTGLSPYFTEAYRELAYLYATKMGLYEEAINECDKISAYDPQNPQVEKDISNIYKLSQGLKYIDH